VQILRAKPKDAATLTEIAFAAKRHWGYPEQWIQNWSHLLTIQPGCIAGHETYAAWMDGHAVGFYSLSRGLDRMNLEHLWVLPEAMGRGVGRALFVHAVERVRASGCAMLEIESDPNAVGFYEQMGAHRAGATVTELEGRPRELPVLVYEIDRAA
jgi:GNAT superfamily N-acetyltransferase